ncbi:MAG TPA: dodecin family protein [Anaerolineae bacterium]|nr:dodecin family protein [Anaerolineae bacterium]
MSTDSVYKVIELVGTSETSWEDAAMQAVQAAKGSLQALRIGEVKAMDLKINENGDVVAYRVKLDVSFKLDA